MEVTVLGPNLNSKHQKVSQFHVHKAGCADITRGFTRDERMQMSDFDVASKAEVAEHYFGRSAGGFFEEGGGDEVFGTYEKFLDQMVGEFHFAPCTKGLA